MLTKAAERAHSRSFDGVDLRQKNPEAHEALRAEYFALLEQLAHDPERMPDKLDALYLPGLTKGSVEACELFDLVTEAVLSGRVGLVFYSGSDGHGAHEHNNHPGGAWPGADWYVGELTSRGVPRDKLIPTGIEGTHTRAEANELAATMKAYRAETVAVATVPYHTVRQLSCLVGAMAQEQYLFRAYYLQPEAVSWDMAVEASQSGGVLQTLREEANDEVERAVAYWSRGMEENNEAWKQAFGAPPQIVRQYLKWRDNASAV